MTPYHSMQVILPIGPLIIFPGYGIGQGYAVILRACIFLLIFLAYA